MTTPILNLKAIPDGMQKPQLSVNENMLSLEAAMNSVFDIDLSSGDYTITDEVSADPDLSFIYSRFFVYRAIGNSVPRDLFVPQKNRVFSVDNAGSSVLSVKRGSAAIAIPSGLAALIYSDGGANSLKLISLVGADPVVSGAVVLEEASSSYSVNSADNTKYLRFTSSGEKTVSVLTNATHALPDNYEVNIRNAAAGNLTISPASGVTVNAPYNGTLVVPPQGTVTLKRASSDVFDLIGATVPE